MSFANFLTKGNTVKIYIMGMNSDIDAFWHVYSENEKPECPDYMFLIERDICSAKDFINLWDEMQSEYDIDNNFMEFFSKHITFN